MEMFCSVHHSFIHDAVIRIEGAPGGELRSFRPDGSEVLAGMAPLEPMVREWLDTAAFGPHVPVDREPVTAGMWDTS